MPSMAYDLGKPAQLKFTGEPVQAPADWSDAEDFASLRMALEAAVERIGDGPWIRTGGETIKPTDIEDLWKGAFRPLSD